MSLTKLGILSAAVLIGGAMSAKAATPSPMSEIEFTKAYNACDGVRADVKDIVYPAMRPGATKAQIEATKQAIYGAELANRCRLSWMVKGLREPNEEKRKEYCDHMMDYIDSSFTHIEGWGPAPMRTADGLHKTCMTPGEWVVSDWKFYKDYVKVHYDRNGNPDLVHITIAYWQNQKNEGYSGNVWRFAERDFVQDNDGVWRNWTHGAYDVHEEAVKNREHEAPMTLPAFVGKAYKG